jgi:hypothetical protein
LLPSEKENDAYHPTYFSLPLIFMTVGIGFVRYLGGALGTVVDPPSMEVVHGTPALSLLLLLRAFSGGTTALPGVGAISNGIPAFREPRSHNAAVTLQWMAGILGTLMLAISFLAVQIGALPSEEETVISQLAPTVYGGRIWAEHRPGGGNLCRMALPLEQVAEGGQ